MMILDILYDSLKYSFSNPKNILKLGLFELFSIFFIPSFFVSGYQYKIIKHSLNLMIHENTQMVELNGFKELFINGIKLYFVKLVYLIIPVSLMILLRLDIIQGLSYLALFTLLFVVMYCYSYVAIAHMIRHDSVRKAFNLKEITNIILNGIGIRVLVGLLIGFIIIYGGCGLFIDDFAYYLSIIINVHFVVFSHMVSVVSVILFLITALFFQPFFHIMVARISGMTYTDL